MEVFYLIKPHFGVGKAVASNNSGLFKRQGLNF